MQTLKLLLLVNFCLLQLVNQSHAQQNPNKYGDYDYGYQYLYDGKIDSAILLFNRYLDHPDDSLKKGKAHLYIGEQLFLTGDLYGAQESLITAVRILTTDEPSHKEYLGYSYKMLGLVDNDLKRYPEAVEFFNQSLAVLPANNADIPEIMNSKAIGLRNMKQFAAAIAIYDSLQARYPHEQYLLSRVIDNRAYTQWLANPTYPALNEFHTALKIRIDSSYREGLNASYAHLADYYTRTNPDSALWYAHKMLEQARTNNSAEDILQAIDKLIRLDNTVAGKTQWYTQFKQLNDSLQLARNSTSHRFAIIRYDVQKNKADNLELKQEVTRRGVLIAALIAAALLIITFIYNLYRKRQKRIKRESEDAIRNASLKTSQKVHDVVANGLYGIMNELEHKHELDREPLMTKIEDLYEKSRNISYEDLPAPDTEGYDEQMHELLHSFASTETKIIIVGNQPAFWKKISPHQKQQLQLVLQELLVNMKKHSRASTVSIVFKEENNRAIIAYRDDGVGLPVDKTFGNGLKNTVNRIKALKGDISFGDSGSAGLSIHISLPL